MHHTPSTLPPPHKTHNILYFIQPTPFWVARLPTYTCTNFPLLLSPPKKTFYTNHTLHIYQIISFILYNSHHPKSHPIYSPHLSPITLTPTLAPTHLTYQKLSRHIFIKNETPLFWLYRARPSLSEMTKVIYHYFPSIISSFYWLLLMYL